MDFCNECGSKTEPEWVFCRSCGNPLEAPEIEAVAAQPIVTNNSPTVELISRGWDVVDIEATALEPDPVLPPDPIESNEVAVPLDPDAVEVSVDEVTVVARPEATEADETVEKEDAADAPSDRWDHLRPHGHIPGVSDPSRVPAKVSQIAVLVAGFAALASAGLHLVLNIQLDRFTAGDVSAGAIADLRTVAEASTLVLAALSILSLAMFVWWMIKALPRHSLGSRAAGWVALLALLGGVALVTYFTLQEKTTVADELTANSLVVIGLGLLMLAALSAIRMISRVEIRDRW
jgi:hypothetical protein